MYKQHIILDFEMNPVPKKSSSVRQCLCREIVEIGAVKLNERYEEVDRFNCFVKPQHSTDVAAYITKLTGIRNSDVQQAISFEEAVVALRQWIGGDATRIYSWSACDLIQLRTECDYKGILFPDNMRRWVDFQPLYPRFMGIDQRKPLMSLCEAAEWYGVTMDTKKAHRALYDAEITANLVKPILTGDYRKQRECLKQTIIKQEHTYSGMSLGDACGGVLNQLLKRMMAEPEFAR